eukprot:scaffold8259_cov143-Cylindrotheca_fusiformis.AAC.6
MNKNDNRSHQTEQEQSRAMSSDSDEAVYVNPPCRLFFFRSHSVGSTKNPVPVSSLRQVSYTSKDSHVVIQLLGLSKNPSVINQLF